MMKSTILVLAFLTSVSLAAPIPKTLKAKKSSTDFEGYWEQTGSNMNGKEGTITHGKYWKVESDKFYYSLSSMEVGSGSSKGVLVTPDESQPNLKTYSTSRCRLEINDDILTWVFANDKEDTLEDCTPNGRRIIYYFKRAGK